KKVPQTVGSISEENYEEYFIAYHEGDLNNNDKKDLDQFLTLNSFLVKEFELHDQLRMIPDDEISYTKKESLKRKTRIQPAIYWASSAAAAVLFILLGIYSIMDQPGAVREELVPDYRISTLESTTLHGPIALLPEMSIQKTNLSIQPIEVNRFTPPVRTRQQEITKMSSRFIMAELNFSAEPVNITVITTYDPGFLYADDSHQSDERKKGNFLGRIIRKIAQGGKNEPGSANDNKEPAFVRILDQSLVVFNTLTGSDSQLEKTYDEKGELTHYRFEGETISWSRDFAPQAK
ncbi:MAG: hypothetical protein P8100_05340, partial [bacterium]